MRLLLLLAVLCGCSPPGPFGVVLRNDGVTYAGAAAIDITPAIIETFTDINGNADFDGCLDDPTAARDGCDEPFDDVDGDGWFDAVFIGGFGPMRPANDVHDPVWARAVVLSQDGEYLAFVGLDLVGLGSPRIHAARDRLADEGWDPDRLVVASTHNHQGPDTMGLWGNPTDFDNPISGRTEAYQERVTAAVAEAVRQAAGAMEAVELNVGTVDLRDRSVWFNGATFGGKNPTARMHGLIQDGRDPVLVSDQLLVVQGAGEAGTVFTWTNWSGHPEVRGSSNNSISSDWVGIMRDVLEDRFGGVALHMPESLGGMQSALGGDLPAVGDDGSWRFADCDEAAVMDAADVDCFGLLPGDARVDGDGDPVPVWAERNSWEFVTAHGWHLADAAVAALEGGEPLSLSPLTIDWESLYVPVDNIAYQILGPLDVFDLGLQDGVFDPELCPRAEESKLGCIETRTAQVQLGDLGFVAVPGELLPELAWGFPDDPAWAAEAEGTTRGAGSTWFPQHPAACDGVDFDDCRDRITVGDCDCLAMHATPYVLSEIPTVGPLLEALPTRHRAVLGMADNYLSYIIPRPDVHRSVSLLSDRDGDHYEDTVTPSWDFAREIQAAQIRITSRRP